MSIVFSGRSSRSAGLISAIAKQLKSINFQPAKKVTVQFDPFHEGSNSARLVFHHIYKIFFHKSAKKTTTKQLLSNMQQKKLPIFMHLRISTK